MSTSALISALAELGIELGHEDGRIWYRPRSAMTPDLAERMRVHKPELLVILQHDPDADLTNASSVWQSALDRLEDNPLFPPDVMEFLRSAATHWADDGEIDHAALRRVRLGPEKLSRCNSTKPLPPTADRNIEGNDTPTDQAENTPADTLDTRHWPTAVGGSRTSPATDDAGRSIDAEMTIKPLDPANFSDFEEYVDANMPCACHSRFGDRLVNVGRAHFAICEKHGRYRWIGSNLFSGWKSETDKDWNENERILDELKPISAAEREAHAVEVAQLRQVYEACHPPVPVTRSEQSADELLDDLGQRGCDLGLDEADRLVTDGVPPDMATAVTAHAAELTKILQIEASSMAEAMDKIIDPPDPCQKCGSLELWESVTGDLFGLTPGRWRCLRCDPPAQARRLRERAARLQGSSRRNLNCNRSRLLSGE